jgi:hypothetical protein
MEKSYVPPDDDDFIIAIVQCPMTVPHIGHYYSAHGGRLTENTPDYMVRYCRGC